MDVTLDMLDVTAIDELNYRITEGYYEVIHRTFEANEEKIKTHLGDSYTRATFSRVLNRKITKSNSSFASESILEKFGNKTGIHFESLREQAFFLTDVFYDFLFVYLVRKEMTTDKTREKYFKYFGDLEDIHGLAVSLRRLFNLMCPATTPAVINRYSRIQVKLYDDNHRDIADSSEKILRSNEIMEGLREGDVEDVEDDKNYLLRTYFVASFVDRVYGLLCDEKKKNNNFIITKPNFGALFCIDKVLPMVVKELKNEIDMSKELKEIFSLQSKLSGEGSNDLLNNMVNKVWNNFVKKKTYEIHYKKTVDNSELIKLYNQNKIYSLQYNTPVDDLKILYR
ncbi:hypothetical protein ACLHIM_07080 [Ligilactobacillus sp. LYQ112]|uniref:hypothetical protein n=1 Tax=Ligilactobacillus sp. LYQ112 TaxID=3391060 RepID=UPI003983811B